MILQNKRTEKTLLLILNLDTSTILLHLTDLGHDVAKLWRRYGEAIAAFCLHVYHVLHPILRGPKGLRGRRIACKQNDWLTLP